MKFSVNIIQKRLYDTTIEVEADNRDQAETKALNQAGDLDFTNNFENEYSVGGIEKVGK